MSKHASPSIQSKKLHLGQLLEKNRLTEAKDLLADLCRRDTGDAQLWLMYGAINQQLGDNNSAAAAYGKAVAMFPDLAVGHYQLGTLNLETGKIEQAVENLQRAVALQPDFLEARCNLGLAFEKLGRYLDASDCYRDALLLHAGVPELHYNLGNALQALGQHEEAQRCYREAVRLRPGYVEAHDHIGVSLAKQDRHEEAIVSYRRALAIRPDHAVTHYNLAKSLKHLNRLDEAIASYGRALAFNPRDSEARVNLGVALAAQQKIDEAIACFREALRLKPDDANAHFNLGATLAEQHKIDEAIACYREALRLKPDDANVHINLGVALNEQQRISEAIACFREALRLMPDDTNAHFNLSALLLLQGDFCNGWQEYQWNWRRKGSTGRPLQPSPWDGSNLNGQKVFLHGEQGLGDEFFFLRFTPWLRQLGAGSITYRPDPRIASLLSRVRGIDRIAAANELPQPGDLVFAIGDLPRLLGMTRIDQIPASLTLTPLLQNTESLKTRLARLGPPPYIGVTWRAGTATKRGALYKETPLPRLADALRRIPGTVLALQRNPLPGETEAFSQALGRPAHDFSALNEDLEGMLALLGLIDDYVGVSNTNMHLRAGVGKTARVLVPSPPEWRWMAKGKESPWFPGFAVYRQGGDGSWDPAFAELATDLENAPGIAER